MAKFFDGQHIERVRIEHIKGAIEVEIYAGAVNELAGKCKAGKTSILDAIKFALAGAKAIDPKPVTHGAEEGKVELETEDFIVTRRLHADGKPYLRIKGKHGGTYGQRDMDKLISNLTFDPTEFSSWDTKKKRTVIRQLAGEVWCAKYDTLNERETNLVAERLELSRQLKDMGTTPEEPEKVERVDSTQLAMDLVHATGLARVRDEAESYVKDRQREVDRLEASLKEARAKLVEAQAGLESLEEPADIDALTAQLENSKATNRQASAWEDWANLKANREGTQDRHDWVDTQIGEIREERTGLMGDACVPIEGLSFDGDEIFVGGTPIAQLSSGETIELSAAIMMALKPEFRIMFVQRGEALDQEMFGKLIATAEENDIQLWIATVSETGEGHGDAIHIYEGRVAA